MAEKEERIFIGFINPEGDACPVPYGKCNSLCDHCQGGMTRQEAIEKISERLEQFTEVPHVLADIAINALLENNLK